MKSNIAVDRIFKLLLIGESNVGKTSIIVRYVDNDFQPTGISTLGVDVKCKYVLLNKTKIRLDIWDTAGQERFRGLAKNYFRGGNGFILVYDITNKKSFGKLKGWINDAKEKIDKDYKMIVVGNKKDCEKEREVEIELLKEFAAKNEVSFLEVSAKTGEGIEQLFNTLVEELLELDNIGVIKDEESEVDKTYNSLDNSRSVENRHNCNC